jgi:hypothetical protein
MDATQRHADESTAQRARDRLTERRLADTGRAHEREDRARATTSDVGEPTLLTELADGEVFDDPILHVLESFVVGVEDATRFDDVQCVVGAHRPRDVGQPVQVCADPPVLGGLLRGALEPAELALRLLADGVRHAGLVDLLAELVGGVFPAFLAELLADRRHLLAQDHLALSLLEVVRHLAPDALLHIDLASVSFAQARTISRRASTSVVSRTSTLRSKLMSGE